VFVFFQLVLLENANSYVIWYSGEGPGPAAAPPSPLLAVPTV